MIKGVVSKICNYLEIINSWNFSQQMNNKWNYSRQFFLKKLNIFNGKYITPTLMNCDVNRKRCISLTLKKYKIMLLEKY